MIFRALILRAIARMELSVSTTVTHAIKFREKLLREGGGAIKRSSPGDGVPFGRRTEFQTSFALPMDMV